MKKKQTFLCFFLLLFLNSGCSKEEVESFTLKTDLISIKEISENIDFMFLSSRDSSTQNCKLYTNRIRRVQNVDKIVTKYRNNQLWINIYLDRDVWPDPLDCYKIIDFKIHNLPQGEYRTQIYIDNYQLNNQTPVYLFY